MQTKPGIQLFTWFSNALGAAGIEAPAKVLRSCGFPEPIPSWIEEIENRVYPLIDKGDGPVPDLESRTQAARRASGQFYTPPSLITHLLREIGPIPGSALDPACGDGAFLLSLASHRHAVSGKPGLETLAGCDLDPEALLIALGRIRRAFPQGGWPRLERRDFLLDPPAERFDLVIGNPPYKVNLDRAMIERLMSTFSTAEGEKDLYTFFLEGGLRALVPGGTLVMLTSHTFLVNKHCSKIREFLFNDHAVRRLFILPAGFFRKAPGVIPVILQVQNRPPDDSALSILQTYSPASGWHDRISSLPRLFNDPTGLRRALRSPGLDSLFTRMEEASRPLGEIARVGVGIQESTHRQEGRISRFVGEARKDGDSVPVLRGREIEPFRVNWEGKFLHYGPHLTYAGDPEIFRNPKILYQNLRHETLSRRLVAALDTDGYFPKNSLSYICRPAEPYSLEYLLGLLNSRLVNLWFREHFFSFHVTVGQVRSIPVPLSSPENRKMVESAVRSILREGCRPDLLQQLETAVTRCFLGDAAIPDQSVLG